MVNWWSWCQRNHMFHQRRYCSYWQPELIRVLNKGDRVLQLVSIACCEERCTSDDRFRLTVWPFVRLSVWPSVTRWHCVTTTPTTITLSSLGDILDTTVWSSSFIHGVSEKRANFKTRYFGVQLERRKVDKRANLHENWNMHTLFYRVF